MLELRFHDEAGHTSTAVLRAGIDTAEWSAACPDVIPTMQHRAAEVYSRFPVTRGAATCQGQRYVTFAELSGGLSGVQSLDYRWVPQGQGVMRLVKIVFVDGPTKRQTRCSRRICGSATLHVGAGLHRKTVSRCTRIYGRCRVPGWFRRRYRLQPTPSYSRSRHPDCRMVGAMYPAGWR